MSELSCRVRDAPGFPEEQVPAQFNRAPRAIERIMLAPLDNIKDGSVSISDDTMPQELLQLNFILAERATLKMIKRLAETLDLALKKAQMPINRVAWGGLNSLEGFQPSNNGNLRDAGPMASIFVPPIRVLGDYSKISQFGM